MSLIDCYSLWISLLPSTFSSSNTQSENPPSIQSKALMHSPIHVIVKLEKYKGMEEMDTEK